MGLIAEITKEWYIIISLVALRVFVGEQDEKGGLYSLGRRQVILVSGHCSRRPVSSFAGERWIVSVYNIESKDIKQLSRVVGYLELNGSVEEEK